MLVVFLLIFVADTKLTYDYNFVAPLTSAIDLNILQVIFGVALIV